MFTNYLKLTLRNLTRNKSYSTINIFGLSVGILCATLILLYITDELSYDRHHELHQHIYRLEGSIKLSDSPYALAFTPLFLGQALKDEYPEIEKMVRFMGIPADRFRYKDKEFSVGSVLLADETVFDIFTHTFLSGAPRK